MITLSTILSLLSIKDKDLTKRELWLFRAMAIIVVVCLDIAILIPMLW